MVHPDYKRVGIGKKLMQYCLKRFSLVRTKVLLTDDELPQKAFYESFGFKTPGN
ncbi:GNAT family N-acetyltransferase [candidate division KSB1 bacterium]|nr:GNAT family N-acetyltransferase [candidate division KSB1 bacterium]